MIDKIKAIFEKSAILTLVSVEGIMFFAGIIVGLVVPSKRKGLTMIASVVAFALSALPVMSKLMKSIKDNY